MNAVHTLPEILVVEDNDADLDLLRQAMRQHHVHAKIRVVKDGEVAIQYVTRREHSDPRGVPDLVILDLNLPKRTGIEVLEFMRRTHSFRRVPVIVFTSSESLEDRTKSEILGVSEFLHKTGDLDEYIQVGDYIKRELRTSGQSGFE